MVARNVRKLQVLAMGIQMTLDSRTLFNEIEDITLCNASTLLKHYYRQGLFNRVWENGQYEYHLTSKGLARYWYLLQEARCPVKQRGKIDWERIERERCLVVDLKVDEVQESLRWIEKNRCPVRRRKEHS